jgi:uncharacterized protein YndB with AHSA1/START domain
MSRQPFSIASTVESGNALRFLPDGESNVLEINRIYRCARPALYNWFVNPDKLKQWMAYNVQGDFVPGSDARLIWNENTFVEIVFEELKQDRRIIFRMKDKQSINTRVVLSFHRHDNMSFLQLSHFFPNQEVERNRMLVLRQKWAFFLDNLASVCEFHFDQRPLKAEEEGWRWLKK